MSENYDLRKSVKALGKLSPVLKDAHGNVIDGLHRLELYPDWPCVTVDFVDTPEKLEAARLAVNTNRRLVSGSEIAMRVEILLKSGLTVEQISGLTGLSERTIYRYKPLELKKPEAKAISEGMLKASEIGRNEIGRDQLTPVTSSIKTPDMAECERCHVSTTMPKPWHGHTLCSKCFERAEFNPVAYDGWFKMLERGKATVTTQPKVTAPSQESWEQRKATMRPQHSKMEEELLLALGNDEALRPVVTDRGYPIVTVTPDFVLTRHNLAIFIDGEEVHAHRQDRDDDLRKKLADRHGLKVLSVTYSSNTEAEKQRIIKQIKEAI